MATKPKPSTARKKWPTNPKQQPIAFMLQPSEFEVVPPERLAEWERLMRDELGCPPQLVSAIRAARLVETISIRGGQAVD